MIKNFNITINKNDRKHKMLRINNTYLYINFYMSPKSDHMLAFELTVDYDEKNKLVIINTKPQKEKTLFRGYRNWIEDCYLSKVMPRGRYDLIEENQGKYTFRLVKIKKGEFINKAT